MNHQIIAHYYYDERKEHIMQEWLPLSGTEQGLIKNHNGSKFAQFSGIIGNQALLQRMNEKQTYGVI